MHIDSTSLKEATNKLRYRNANIPDTESIEITEGVYIRICSYAPTGEEVKTEDGELKHIQTRDGYDEDTIADDLSEYELKHMTLDFRIALTPDFNELDTDRKLRHYEGLSKIEQEFEEIFFEVFGEEYNEVQKYPDQTEFSFDEQPTWVMHEEIEDTVWFYGPIVCLPILDEL